jgi:L-alanine-DL-glutamate epimerase-like enolase superfamily enzyme
MEISRSQFLRNGLLLSCGLGFGLTAGDPAPAGGAPKPAPPPSGGSGKAELRFHPIELHLRHAWRLSRNTSTQKRNYVVELRAGGVTGLGEAAPNVRFGETPETVERALAEAAQVVAEVHPGHRVELARRLRERLPGAHAARCAVDMALWDWQTRSLGVPLWRYLGLDPKAAPLTSFSLSIADKDELVQKVREAAAFPLLKVKLGARGAFGDRDIVRTILEAAPGRVLRVDPNEGWTPAEAVAHLRHLAGLRVSLEGRDVPAVELCEQPLPARDLPALRALYADPARPRGLPLLLDESVLSARDLPGLVGACDGVVIKLQKAGGVSGALEQITVARALGMKVMLGCMIESSLGISAAAHLAPLCDYIDLDGNLLVDNDPYQGVRCQAGRLSLPEGPGLGVAPVLQRKG